MPSITRSVIVGMVCLDTDAGAGTFGQLLRQLIADDIRPRHRWRGPDDYLLSLGIAPEGPTVVESEVESG